MIVVKLSPHDTNVVAIPSHRRENSFVGTTEGFDLFCPKDFRFSAPCSPSNLGAMALPSPDDNHISQDFGKDYAFKSGLKNMKHSIQGSLDFDGININTDFVLGAIPTQDETYCKLFAGLEINKQTTNPMKPYEESDSSLSLSESSLFSSKKTKISKKQEAINKKEVVYTKAERRQKITNYRAKRASRVYGKKIMYECRKSFASSRPRVGGRFIGKGETVPSPTVKPELSVEVPLDSNEEVIKTERTEMLMSETEDFDQDEEIKC